MNCVFLVSLAFIILFPYCIPRSGTMPSGRGPPPPPRSNKGRVKASRIAAEEYDDEIDYEARRGDPRDRDAYDEEDYGDDQYDRNGTSRS